MARPNKLCAGIDAGSRAIKVVVWDPARTCVLAAGAVDQGVAQESLAMELLDKLLDKLPDDGGRMGRDDLGAVVATGYGRKLIARADQAITEITCQAWGVRQRWPGVRTIVDIGGQDSKVLRLAADGSIDDFVLNDRCAAGSGRFLEVLAARLGVDLPALGLLTQASRKPALISTMCVVFAETEIVGLLASGMAPADIVSGVQTALARRIAAMVGQHPPQPIVLTGGVALIPGMDAALAAALGAEVSISPDPQLTGALGAAVLAARRMNGRGTPAL